MPVPNLEHSFPDLDDLDWVTKAQCVIENRDWSEYFVQAGHSIPEEALDACRRCEVRAECLTWAYKKNAGAGYFGGLSHGTRKKLPLEQALVFIKQGGVER